MLTATAPRVVDMLQTDAMAAVRQRDFARLDKTGTAYLDYTGAALYPESIVRREMERLSAGVFGNPHSQSVASQASTDALHEARTLTLQLFEADADEYDVIFTANASSAIRILAEAFPFGRRSRLVMTADNHNSVNGLRVTAGQHGATVAYVPLDRDLRSRDPGPQLSLTAGPSLFAFPAQSNFSGVRHPLPWVSQARSRGYHVLLDAAAFVGTSHLSLSKIPADFVAVSYYKLFGYPSGVGALLARRDAMPILRRRFFAGGTVQFVSVQNDGARAKAGPEAFEDGTPNFLAMPAVCDGLRWFHSLGVDAIERHVASLTATLVERLTAMDDRVALYGPSTAEARGGSIAFNLRCDGRILPYEDIEAAARACGLAIRGGCFCNPGAAERAFNYPADRARACLRGPFSVSRFRNCLGGPPVGALRASVGIPTNGADVNRLIDCLSGLFSSS
jgi:selenocysteine lyase/cysteine desulfurase